MPLIVKISGASLAVIAFAISLLVFLTFFKYESTLYTLVSSRFQVIADDAEDTISKGLSLGTDLQELKTTEKVIADIKKKDEQILSIQVFQRIGNLKAKTLYNTRAAGVGGRVPKLWMAHIQAAGKKRTWQFRTGNANVVGVNIIDALGDASGGIAVRFSQKYMDKKKSEMLHYIIGDALKIFAVTCLIILCASYWFFRKISYTFDHMRVAVDEVLRSGKLKKKFNPHSIVDENFSKVLTTSISILEELTQIEQALPPTTSVDKKGK